MSGQLRSLTERLAEQLHRPIDAQTRRRARLHLVDWLACVAGGRADPMFAIARRAEPDMLTRAALLGNVLEMDDVDRIGRLHPGPVIWPAALSAAREEQASLGRLLDGAVRGYEAMVRIGRSLDHHHYAHWHPTATAGGMGAAVAAASVFGMERDAMVSAMGHAGSLAGGLWQVRHEPGAMTKAVHAAQAALGGLWHARLARQGCMGPRFILEGPQGLFAAMTSTPHAEAITEAADGWRMDETSFKPWGACRHTHPAIDAALTLPHGALASGPIWVESYADALAFCNRPDPGTPAEAKFSLQHAVAVVAVRGAPKLADFAMDAIADPAIEAARSRVKVAVAPRIDAAYPAHYGARVSAGGATALRTDAWGDPEWPLDRAGLEAKLAALVDWGGLDCSEVEAAAGLALDEPDQSPAADLLRLVERWVT